MEELYGGPAAVWRPWCAGRVERAVIESGPHMAEDNPDQLASILKQFLVS